MTNILDRHKVLSAAVLKREIVEVPELGGSVHIQELAGGDRDAWVAEHFDTDGDEPELRSGKARTFRASLVCLTLIDENGRRMFQDAEIERVAKFPSTILDLLYNASAKLSALDEESQKALEKN